MMKYVVCGSNIMLNIVFNQMMKHKSFQHIFQRVSAKNECLVQISIYKISDYARILLH
jgi:hypothetical protein